MHMTCRRPILLCMQATSLHDMRLAKGCKLRGAAACKHDRPHSQLTVSVSPEMCMHVLSQSWMCLCRAVLPLRVCRITHVTAGPCLSGHTCCMQQHRCGCRAMSDCAHVLHAGHYMLLQAMQAGKGQASSSVWAAGRHRFHHHHSCGASLGGAGLPLSVPVSVPAPQPQ